jgi:uncharacterized protein YcaQ
MELSKTEARLFLLNHHRLFPARNLIGEDGVLDYIRHVGCIQFDPLNVVGRNPDLVLQSRIKNYRPSILRNLLYKNRKLMDGWDKMASIYVIEDWPFFTKHRDAIEQRTIERRPTRATINYVLDELTTNGPHSSLHYKGSEKVDWFWGPTNLYRAALEYLFSIGQIGIESRINNRRNFDLIENLLPGCIRERSDPFKTLDKYHDWHFYRRTGSMGIIDSRAENWRGILDVNKNNRIRTLDRLERSGQLVCIKIEGFSGKTFYIREKDKPTLDSLFRKDQNPKNASIIAPLDNLIWNRRIIRELFDFNYVWEVYKPKKDRKFGYYVLPVLFKDRFIARFEPKFNKKLKTLTIINWWWENNVDQDSTMIQALEYCFRDFLRFLNASFLILSDQVKDQHRLKWVKNLLPN